MNPALNSQKKIKEIFAQVRDTPYKLVPFRDIGSLLRLGFGDCRAKHALLAKEYKKIGIPTKLIFMKFHWCDLPIPKDIAEELGNIWPHYASHYALRIKVDNKWINVDATWDKPLKSLGFPVNDQWDGRTDTNFATTKITKFTVLNPLTKWLEKVKEELATIIHRKEYYVLSEELHRFFEKARPLFPKKST